MALLARFLGPKTLFAMQIHAPSIPIKSLQLHHLSFGLQTDYFRPVLPPFSFHFARRLLETTSECAERLHTPATTRRENFPLQSRLAIRAECAPTGTKYVCTLVLSTPFVSRISRYDEYFFRSNYFLILKVIIIFVRLEVSVVITDRDLNFLEMYHKILTKLFSQFCVG